MPTDKIPIVRTQKIKGVGYVYEDYLFGAKRKNKHGIIVSTLENLGKTANLFQIRIIWLDKRKLKKKKKLNQISSQLACVISVPLTSLMKDLNTTT